MFILSDMLGIPQDIVSDISSSNQNGIFMIHLSLKVKPHACPSCGHFTSHIKEYKIKHIKHSLLNRQQCLIHYKARRFVCDFCGRSFFENNPFSSSGRSISNHSKYVCLLLDFNSHELIDMLPERKKFSLFKYFDKISIEERSHVRFFVMDMYYVYRDVIHSRFSNARIAVDSFHVVMNINKALDNVRIRIMKGFKKDSVEYYLLKNFKWLLLEKEVRENKRKFNRRLNRYVNYPQLLDLILKISPELNEAYLIKDRYLLFNSCCDFHNAEKDFNDILYFISKSKIPEMIAIYKMLNNWTEEILNSFIVINGRRLSNGIMESRNSIVKLIKKTGNGYVNFARFRNRCMYCMNKDSNPDLSGNAIPIKMKGHKRGPYKKQ